MVYQVYLNRPIMIVWWIFHVFYRLLSISPPLSLSSFSLTQRKQNIYRGNRIRFLSFRTFKPYHVFQEAGRRVCWTFWREGMTVGVWRAICFWMAYRGRAKWCAPVPLTSDKTIVCLRTWLSRKRWCSWHNWNCHRLFPRRT